MRDSASQLQLATEQTSVFFTGEISPEGDFFPSGLFLAKFGPKKTFLSPKIHPF
jgi:hypothetical protein